MKNMILLKFLSFILSRKIHVDRVQCAFIPDQYEIKQKTLFINCDCNSSFFSIEPDERLNFLRDMALRELRLLYFLSLMGGYSGVCLSFYYQETSGEIIRLYRIGGLIKPFKLSFPIANFMKEEICNEILIKNYRVPSSIRKL